MRERKRGTVNQFAGNLSNDVQEVKKLSLEKAPEQANATHTFYCDAILTIYCC